MAEKTDGQYWPTDHNWGDVGLLARLKKLNSTGRHKFPSLDTSILRKALEPIEVTGFQRFVEFMEQDEADAACAAIDFGRYTGA